MDINNKNYKNNYDNFLVGEPYYQKINFNIFKEYDFFENNAFITCICKGLIKPYELIEIFRYLEPEQKLIISLTNEQPDIDHPRVINIREHPKDFHSLFNTYIYYHTGYLDPHPRLFHECVFYGKKIVYINNDNVKDGSFFRYHDAIENGIKNISMTENDVLIQEMLK